ncbi:ATP-dependent serine protease, partial [Shigella flexneri 1235-66]
MPARHPAGGTALTRYTVAKAPKRAFVCNECGADYPRWQGQC